MNNATCPVIVIIVQNRGKAGERIICDVCLPLLLPRNTSLYRKFFGLKDAGSACYPIAKIKK